MSFLRRLFYLENLIKHLLFQKSVWDEDELFFEADLLLGLNFFKNKDYKNSEKHFERLNKISQIQFFFKDFIGNVLIAWNKASTR